MSYLEDTKTGKTQRDTPYEGLGEDSETDKTGGDTPLQSTILTRFSLERMVSKAMTAPAVTWSVPGLIPDGLTIFAGGSKIGKSFACLDLAVAVAAGSAAMGEAFVCNQGDVLYIAGEDTARRVTERMDLLLPDRALFPWDSLMIATQEMLIDENRQRIRPGLIAQEWAEKASNPRMMIVDTKARVIDPWVQANARKNAYNADYDSMAGLHDFAVEHGFSLVVVTHTNQMRLEEGEDWFVKIQGTTGVPGVADGVILLDAKRGQNEGVLRVAGRDIPDNEMTVVRAGPWWHVTDGAPRGRLGDRTIDIRDWVVAQELPVAPKDVAEHFQMSPQSAGKYLQRLRAAGHLKSIGHGRYAKADE